MSTLGRVGSRAGKRIGKSVSSFLGGAPANIDSVKSAPRYGSAGLAANRNVETRSRFGISGQAANRNVETTSPSLSYGNESDTLPFVAMPGGKDKQVLGSMWPPSNFGANVDTSAASVGRAEAQARATANSQKAWANVNNDPMHGPAAPYSAPSATKGAAPWQSPDYKDWGPNNQMVPSTPEGESAFDKKGMFSKLTSQSWFGNAAMGAGVGAATGALNPGGNDGMIGGALGGAVVGGLAGGFGGHFLKGVEKTGMGMKISGGKIGFNPAAGNEFSGISQAAALGVVGGLVGGAKSKRFSTVQSNGWAQGTANMHFPGGY